MDERTLYALYVVAMAIGAFVFLLMGQNRRGVPAEEYLIAMFIPIWSGLAYLSMAFGQGSVEVNGQTVYFARYLDWVVTTPLLLVALAFTAMYKVKKDFVLIGGLIAADVVMILTGLIADLSPEPVRFLWYALGVAALAVLLYLVWGPVRARARQNPDPRIAGITTKLVTFLTVFWFVYPLVWLLGPSGVGVIDRGLETLLFVVVPIISKVGFSLYDLTMLRRLEAESAPGARAYA